MRICSRQTLGEGVTGGAGTRPRPASSHKRTTACLALQMLTWPDLRDEYHPGKLATTETRQAFTRGSFRVTLAFGASGPERVLACQGRCLPSGYRYYCCRGKLSALRSHGQTKCLSRYIPAEQVDALVWEDLCRLLNEPEAIRFALERAHGGHWLPQDLQARRQALRRGQASVQHQMERLTEASLASIVSLEEYRRRRLDLEQKAQSLAAQKRRA